MDFLFYFFICITATTLGAIAGIGGGVIIKPVLDALGGLSVASIGFLSGCTVLAMSVVSRLRSRCQGRSQERDHAGCGGRRGRRRREISV